MPVMKQALVGALVWAAIAHAEEAKMQFTLSSPSFRQDQTLPAKHTCEGADASPALKWDGAPAGTKGFALICDDPDAPGGTWTHWVIYGMPAGATELPENVAKTDTASGAKQGMNDFGRIGYGGPCPPPGKLHHYHFKLFALDVELNLAARVSRRQLEYAMRGHILGQVELMGTYRRD
jgi:Raf kinase inhibitor-like YbhB/YbcL family protein